MARAAGRPAPICRTRCSATVHWRPPSQRFVRPARCPPNRAARNIARPLRQRTLRRPPPQRVRTAPSADRNSSPRPPTMGIARSLRRDRRRRRPVAPLQKLSATTCGSGSRTLGRWEVPARPRSSRRRKSVRSPSRRRCPSCTRTDGGWRASVATHPHFALRGSRRRAQGARRPLPAVVARVRPRRSKRLATTSLKHQAPVLIYIGATPCPCAGGVGRALGSWEAHGSWLAPIVAPPPQQAQSV
mmetsp:Transcript_5195/g.14937  ORF Transcript_5195/g.14937 Transcript_5195/m.14937 type:complete len:244 (-) Transcript_5195:268-999(-)